MSPPKCGRGVTRTVRHGDKLLCNRGEFTSDEFFDFCEQHGIKRQFSTARTPHQTGVVEIMKKTIQQMARTMLDESGTPVTF